MKFFTNTMNFFIFEMEMEMEYAGNTLGNGGRSPCGSAYFVSPDAIFGQRVAEKLKR